MPFRMTVNQPHLGDKGAVYIHGLGTFTNGVHEISDDLEQNFRVANTRDEGAYCADLDAPEAGIYVHKHVEGPSLLDAASGMHGIIVDEIDADGNLVHKKSSLTISDETGPELVYLQGDETIVDSTDRSSGGDE